MRRGEQIRTEDLRWVDQLTTPAFSWTSKTVCTELESKFHYLSWEEQGISALIVYQILAWETVEILLIATSPEKHRTGLAKELLARAVMEWRMRGFTSIRLEAHENNFAARQLYTAFQFEIVGLRTNYYGDGAAAVLYEKFLALRSPEG